MNERLAQLRASLGISQEEMGRRIGVSRFCISNYEAGARNITERAVQQICREFNVNYAWLSTGDGPMFQESDESLGALIDAALDTDNELARTIFKGFARFDAGDWQKLNEIMDKFLSGFSAEEVQAFLAKHTGGENGD